MFNRTLKRPMFRRGGSTGEGITSGLAPRQGFSTGSTRDRLMKAVGPSRSNLNDFLINFGLNMASGTPTGNIFQTAAAQAKEPYQQFSQATRADDDLMRKIALEAETLDIGQEHALALQREKNKSATNASNYYKRAKEAFELGAINPSTGEPYKSIEEAFSILSLGTGDEARASEVDRIASLTSSYVAQGDDYGIAKNKAGWDIVVKDKLTEAVSADLIGGQLPTVKASRDKILKKESSVGKYFYDITDGKVKKFNGIMEKAGQKGYDWTELDQTTFEEIIPTGEEVIDKETLIGSTESPTKLTRAQAEAEAEARGLILIPPFSVRGEGAKFRRENDGAVSIVELQEIIDKERMAVTYAGKRTAERTR